MSLQLELINHYCEEYSSENYAVLDAIQRNIALNTPDPSLSSDFTQGRLLSLFSRLMQPTHILEIGTFLGYSTICLSEGLSNEGRIDTIEKNELLSERIMEHLEMANISHQVNVHFGDALSILHKFELGHYDLYFIDAAKKEYKSYYECIISKAKSGAVILVDNVLWKGKVLDKISRGIAKAMQNFNAIVKDDNRVSNFILPVRDGINVITVL